MRPMLENGGSTYIHLKRGNEKKEYNKAKCWQN